MPQARARRRQPGGLGANQRGFPPVGQHPHVDTQTAPCVPLQNTPRQGVADAMQAQRRQRRGGGGGIAFAAGASRIFSVPGYLLTVSFAVLPVPLAFHLLW